jgi:hypothetical protein
VTRWASPARPGPADEQRDVAGPGRAIVREEYDYGHPATEHAWSANTTAKYTAYRYKGIQ